LNTTFLRGSGSTEQHSPDFLVEKNVTIVTLNHRIGVYGFLSLNDSSLKVPGNAGLKDQRLALKWVQQNIANFGGDPNRVTLFGFSAGSCATHYHMLSENSRGLFHRGISMGGNAIQNSAGIFPSERWAQVLVSRLGFTGDLSSDREILEFLETADPVQVVTQTASLVPFSELLNRALLAFGPTIEPYDTEGVFLNRDLYELMENSWGNDIPFMMGQTSSENLGFILVLRSDPEMFKAFENYENFIPRALGVERNTKKSKKYAEMIRNVYYPVFEPTVTNIDGFAFVS
jgi:cholinesterase